jgi:hypothetical protein
MPPFVDVDGNALVTVNDIILVINGIRSQLIGNGEAEGESLSGEGEAPEAIGEAASATQTAPAQNAGDVSFVAAPRQTEPAPRDDQRSESLRSSHLGNELLLANSNFRTYEFESALADIAGDVSGAWSDEDDNDLEDYFPYSDLFQADRN